MIFVKRTFDGKSIVAKLQDFNRETSDEGREGVKWELGLALFWTGKMGFTHWDWDLATGNGMNNYKMEMGFLFFSGLCSNILK